LGLPRQKRRARSLCVGFHIRRCSRWKIVIVHKPLLKAFQPSLFFLPDERCARAPLQSSCMLKRKGPRILQALRPFTPNVRVKYGWAAEEVRHQTPRMRVSGPDLFAAEDSWRPGDPWVNDGNRLDFRLAQAMSERSAAIQHAETPAAAPLASANGALLRYHCDLDRMLFGGVSEHLHPRGRHPTCCPFSPPPRATIPLSCSMSPSCFPPALRPTSSHLLLLLSPLWVMALWPFAMRGIPRSPHRSTRQVRMCLRTLACGR
jgi:hypothetical protein